METFYKSISLITLVQGLIFGSIFILGSKKNLSLKLLGFFLLTGIGPNLQSIVIFIFERKIYLPLSFAFFTPAIFFLYVKSILGNFNKKDLFHLIPGITEFLFFFVLFFYTDELAKPFYNPNLNPVYKFYFLFLIPVYCTYYYTLSLVHLNKKKQLIPHFYSIHELKRINWINITCYILISFCVLDFLNSFLLIETNLDAYVMISITTGAAFIVYWVSIYGLNQKNLLLPDNNDSTFSEDKFIKNISKEASKDENFVRDEKLESDYKKILDLFYDTKIYKNKDINLFFIADMAQIPYRQVTKLIKLNGYNNFNQFINNFRIEEAKKLIENENLNKFNLSGIASEVGFNSRSAFYSAFKSQVGQTPNEYKNSRQKSQLE